MTRLRILLSTVFIPFSLLASSDEKAPDDSQVSKKELDSKFPSNIPSIDLDDWLNNGRY